MTSDGRRSYLAQAEDTSVEVDEILMHAYRSMPPWEKARRVSELCRTTHELALAGVRLRHPGCTGEETRLRLAALRLDPSTMRRLFAWDPELEGY